MTAWGWLLVLAAVVVDASKDDSYYIAGTGNPNVNSKMYWKDADNVLQDLSQFSALYVKFQSCTWTLMQNEGEGDEEVDENDYFYMNKIPPFGANVAYSLYGVLKGGSTSGCSQATFINSFVTNGGFTDFVSAMSSAGMSSFSSLTYGGSSLSAECQGYYGVGCDSVNGFAMHSYSSSICDPAKFSGVKNSLSSLNSAMSQAKCVKIYDSSYSYSSSSSYGYSSSSGSALSLLSNSHSCFYQDFFAPEGCPDPYGILAGYQKKFHAGITESRRRNPYSLYKERKHYNEQVEEGKLMSGIAVPIFVLACLIFTWDVTKHGFRVRRKKDKSAKQQKQDAGDSTDGSSSDESVTKDLEQGYYTCGHFDVDISPACGEEVNKDVNEFVGEATMLIVGEEGMPPFHDGVSVSNGADVESVYYPPGCVLSPECVEPSSSKDSDDGILSEAGADDEVVQDAPNDKTIIKETLPRYAPPPREDLDIDAFSLGETTIDTKDAMSIGSTTIDSEQGSKYAAIRVQPSKDAVSNKIEAPVIKEEGEDEESSEASSHPTVVEVGVPAPKDTTPKTAKKSKKEISETLSDNKEEETHSDNTAQGKVEEDIMSKPNEFNSEMAAEKPVTDNERAENPTAEFSETAASSTDQVAELLPEEAAKEERNENMVEELPSIDKEGLKVEENEARSKGTTETKTKTGGQLEFVAVPELSQKEQVIGEVGVKTQEGDGTDAVEDERGSTEDVYQSRESSDDVSGESGSPGSQENVDTAAPSVDADERNMEEKDTPDIDELNDVRVKPTQTSPVSDALSLGETTIDSKDAMSFDTANDQGYRAFSFLRTQPSRDASMKAGAVTITEEEEDKDSTNSEHPEIAEVTVPSDDVTDTGKQMKRSSSDEIKKAAVKANEEVVEAQKDDAEQVAHEIFEANETTVASVTTEDNKGIEVFDPELAILASRSHSTTAGSEIQQQGEEEVICASAEQAMEETVPSFDPELAIMASRSRSTVAETETLDAVPISEESPAIQETVPSFDPELAIMASRSHSTIAARAETEIPDTAPLVEESAIQETVPSFDPELAIMASRSHSTVGDESQIIDEQVVVEGTSPGMNNSSSSSFDPEEAIILSRMTSESEDHKENREFSP